MTAQQRLWLVFGGLCAVSLVLLGSITVSSGATSPIVTLIVLVAVGIAAYQERQGRQHR